eukprot:5037134-Prymnesium_polylepis.1
MHVAGSGRGAQAAGPNGEPNRALPLVTPGTWGMIAFRIGATMLLGHWGVSGGASVMLKVCVCHTRTKLNHARI